MELQSNERQRCPTYAAALAETLSEQKNIWEEARIEVLKKESAPSSGVNRVPLNDSSDEPERMKDSRSKKRNVSRNQKLRAAKEEIKMLKTNPSQSGRSPPPQKRSRSPPKAPKERKEMVPAK